MAGNRKIGVLEWAVMGVALLLFTYFASYGPMTKIYANTANDAFDMVYDTIYFPVYWLWENTPLDSFIDWYEDLWI